MTLYFAYGSNLCIRSMLLRCPDAEPLCRFTLNESRLVFRGVADCIYEEGATCVGGLWRITPECELRLDRYEGIASGTYRKDYVDIDGYDEPRLMLYVMNSTGIFPPSRAYVDTIREGYRDFKIDERQLDAAIAHAWDREAPSHIERNRHSRAGRPTLAPHPRCKVAPPIKSSEPVKGKKKGRKKMAQVYTLPQLPLRNVVRGETFDEWVRRKAAEKSLQRMPRKDVFHDDW